MKRFTSTKAILAVMVGATFVVVTLRPEPSAAAGFALTSPEVAEGGTLPKDYTGDGSASTLPLRWSGAPAGTRSYALVMHHVPPENVAKWYWVLYDIPASVTSLPKNVRGIGTLGNNSVNRATAYAPPKSKGPGEKKYTYTIYALSAPPKITVAPSEVSRDVLLTAMKDLVLASAELNVFYTREGATGEADRRPGPGGDGQQLERPRPDGASEDPRTGPAPARAWVAAVRNVVPADRTIRWCERSMPTEMASFPRRS